VEILENIFSEFKSRGLDVSYQEFIAMNMLEDFMIDEDQVLTETQKYDVTNSWITKCLNSRIASLDLLITNAVHNTLQHTTPKQSLDGYCFNSTAELRNKEIWSQKYLVSRVEEEEKKEDEEDETMSDVQIDILEEKEEEEEDVEDKLEDKIKIIGNKRKREYKKTWFKTTIISNDPKIRRDISNSKENNYWNAIAKSINTKYVHTIVWRKDVTDILRDYENISMKIDGIIAVQIDKEKARLKLKNYVLHEGRYRDILLNDKSRLLYDDLINKENMTINIMISDKKWKILKIINDTPNYELEWKQVEYAERPQLEMDFTPVQWD
jgi:hypothetical protein